MHFLNVIEINNYITLFPLSLDNILYYVRSGPQEKKSWFSNHHNLHAWVDEAFWNWGGGGEFL